jgi:hypothetical protein
MARKRVRKFGALLGTIAVTTMLVLYFLAFPAFWATMAGKVFTFVWLAAALVTLVAFGQRAFTGKRKRVLASVYTFKGPAQPASRLGKGPNQKGAS